MKKILATGTIGIIVLSVLWAILQTAFGYIFAQLKPLVTMALGNHGSYITFLGAIFLIFILIVFIGTILTRHRIRKLFTRTVDRIPEYIKKNRGATVEISEGTYYFAIITKKIKLKFGPILIDHYILFQPSAPFPPTGALHAVRSDRVNILKLSAAEVLSMAASYGTSSPNVIEVNGKEGTG